ncbi:survival motor neuron protein [Anopheles marshallii]|uniref:survival motor neuron protein n=1 Tax=Anopheles marshallii TaxID=1521116 RepID=UPI00237B5808|nr:survival motor neuron protein [Anopheles marshallii]
MSTSGRHSQMPNDVPEAQVEAASVPLGGAIGRDDIWDDSIIIKKYDASLALVKAEVAKRLAMNTNRNALAEAAGCSGIKTRKQQKKDSDSTGGEATVGTPEHEEKGTMEISEHEQPMFNGPRTDTFEIGDYVRATYDDGVDYEGKIIGFGNQGDCLIRYVGYNNEQTVLLEELLPSWGRKARRQQRVEAAEAEAAAADSQMDISDDERFTKQASKIKINFGPNFGRSSVGPTTTGRSGRSGMLGPSMSTAYMVPPPPPMPPMLEDADDVESENLSAMLMSWYMSGYYTGLYHGQRMSQQQQQQHTQQKRARQS